MTIVDDRPPSDTGGPGNTGDPGNPGGPGDRSGSGGPGDSGGPRGGGQPEGGPDRRSGANRRRNLIVAGVLAVIIAITVVTDLPVHSSRATQIAADSSVIHSVNSDVASCAYGVNESFTIWRDDLAHTLTSDDRRLAPSLLTQDQDSCSFTNDSIYQLSTIETPGSTSGKYVAILVERVTTWATSDALAAIEAIQTLYSHPGDARAAASLATAERHLASDRAIAERDRELAQDVVSAPLPVLDLPAPHL